jgi:hypothetical protein
MARLVVKRTPWWVTHRKMAMVWLPLAGLQAATLAGFGYFYNRLDDLEQHADKSPPRAIVVSDSPVLTKGADISVVSPVPPIPVDSPASAADVAAAKEVLLQAATTILQDNKAADDKSEGKIVLAAKPEPTYEPKPKPQPHPHPQPKAQVIPEKKKPAPPVEERKHPVNTDTERTAKANSETLRRSGPAVAVAAPEAAVEGVWVYLGELRNYGWYDQKLHIPPASGLPEVGQTYKTQHIVGVYDVPYGEQRAGEFHLGESVFLYEVRRGRKDDVWGRVSAR